jgi:heme-degrading monooxygenase HmoA
VGWDTRIHIFDTRGLMPVVSITRLRVRAWRFLPAFIFAAARIARQARRAQGILHTNLLRDRGNAFWTCTCWESETAMRTFMLAEPHGAAMRKLLNWCDEAALVHWTQDDATLPTWEEAHARLQRDGRPSKVLHPTRRISRMRLRRRTRGPRERCGPGRKRPASSSWPLVPIVNFLA